MFLHFVPLWVLDIQYHWEYIHFELKLNDKFVNLWLYLEQLVNQKMVLKSLSIILNKVKFFSNETRFQL